MNCTDLTVQRTISDQLNEDACHRQKKSLKRILKGGKMAIDVLNSKSEKAYHWGVKTAFTIENGILIFKNWVISNFLLREEKAKASVADGMKWNLPLLRGMTRLVDDSGRRANKVGRSDRQAWECRTMESHRPQAWGLLF
jgi:hypothetical protein